jgi:hypothetical protein
MVRYCFQFVSAQMKKFSTLMFSLLIGLFSSGPALATVLAEGKPKGGYYWQKVSGSNGTKMLCRAQSEAKIKKADQCNTAGAVKPE